MAKPTILDAWGRPIIAAALTKEVAQPRIGSARTPAAGYPADGLTPPRLANILRAADMGEPRQFLELAEAIEERDPHYLGVIGTRRRSVSQLEITVEAGSDDPEDEAIAQMVRDWVERDELAGELFNILDCLSKGYSGTEVVYETSESQYIPRLIWRDPRSFKFDKSDLATPMLIGDYGQLKPLDPGHFIWANIPAKSGLALRSGLARVAAWGWMFKAYTQRDWAIFTQTYGQPVRLGKYGAGASDQDKQTLFAAVANIAGDCAAIIPESMAIEFVEAGNVGAAHQLYKERADWIDQQISKAVLGQTSTTDAVVGGLGSGKEHREVQKDIETADAKALAAILNRDLVRVWVQLEYGPRKRYPRIKISREDEEDLKAFADAVGPMIDRGLEVDQADVRTRFGLPEPKAGAKLMSARAAAPPVPPDQASSSDFKRVSGEIKRVQPSPGTETAPQAEGHLAGKSGGLSVPPSPPEVQTDQLASGASPSIAAILAKLDEMTAAATSFDELRQMALEAFPGIPVDDLVHIMALGFAAADLAGRVASAEESQATP